jgi:hypothetical protein
MEFCINNNKWEIDESVILTYVLRCPNKQKVAFSWRRISSNSEGSYGGRALKVKTKVREKGGKTTYARSQCGELHYEM